MTEDIQFVVLTVSTIRDADLILVMKDGTVIERGTHNELLAAGGFYSKLWNSGKL